MSLNLGFCVPVEDWRLSRGFHPSKVGGKPVWLVPEALPKSKCELCKCNLKFILQIYAPGNYVDESAPDNAFHRIIYLFVCSSKNNCPAEPIVIRQQLPQSNKFYPQEAPDYEDPSEIEKLDLSHPLKIGICNLCGFEGSARCTACKKVNYCSKDCQVYHWKNGHKQACKSGLGQLDGNNNFVLKEYELVSEEAEDNQIKIDDGDMEEDNEEDLKIEEAEKEAENIKQSLKGVDMNELDEKEALAKELDDEFFQEWVSILAKEPEQVIRYHRGIDSCVLPFEVTDDQSKPVCDPGICPNCGAEREFEFQTTPHLLIKTNLDFIEDLATILVYTCSRDCTPNDGASFIRERAIKVHYKR